MRAWSTSRAGRGRRGMGAMVAFVIWVVTIALIYALMSGQAQSGALTGIVRVSGLRMVILAAQSALAEASYVLRYQPEGGSPVLKGIKNGSDAGDAHDPAATRELYKKEVDERRLTLEPVRYKVMLKGARPQDPWHIDLMVRSTYIFAGTKITRQIRRRILGHVYEIKGVEGPSKGKTVLTALSIRNDVLFEVVEP